MNAPLATAIRTGTLVPLTRPCWVNTGQHLLAGVELAVREANESRAIAGSPVKSAAKDPKIP